MSHGVDHPVHRVPRDAECEPWDQLLQWRTAIRTYDEDRLSTVHRDHMSRCERMAHWFEHHEFSNVQSVHAHGLYAWCRWNSWMMCKGCMSMVPCSLRANRMSNQNVMTSLRNCRSCAMEYVVLNHEILSALRVFDVDLGNAPPRHAAGFRRHGGILSLSWCLNSVEEKLENLGAGSRFRGEEALLCLLALRESAYSHFYREHRNFLQSSESDAKLPITFLSTKYLECALWPDLFPFKSWWDSYWDGSENMYRSAKASYLSKVLCPIVEHGMSFDLLQYNFDK